MSIVSSLSKLLIKMGGTPGAYDTSDELVDRIADAYSGSSGNGVLIVTATWDELETEQTLDKTWQEIHDADFAVIVFTDIEDKSFYPVLFVNEALGGGYQVGVLDTASETGSRIYFSESTSGYPKFSAGLIIPGPGNNDITYN